MLLRSRGAKVVSIVMKKVLLLAVFAAGVVFCANAQDKKVSWGVRAGMNLSNIGDKYTGESKADYEQDFKTRVGFNIGVVMDWNLSEHFTIQPGLYFTTRGGKLEENDDDYNEKWRASYLQLPVLASYRFNLSDKVKWHINAGPYIACGLGGKVKWEEDTDKGDYKIFKTTDTDSDEEGGGVKRFDAGLNFGTGISINKVYIGVSYDLGLANILDDKQWGKDYKARNRNFAITLGYNF